jgi:hypothetical protein
MALLYRSMGWGLEPTYWEADWVFSEPLAQGGEQRIEVRAHVPERLFMPLPWFDSPPPQAVTFDFGAVNVQGAYTLTALLQPDWMLQWVDEAGEPIRAEWSFAPNRKLPDAETVYLKPVAGLQGGERIRLDLVLDPAMAQLEKEAQELVIERPHQAIGRRFLLLFFGEFGLFLSVIIFLTGTLWKYLQDKQKEENQQEQKKLQEILDLSNNNLLNAIEKLMQFDKSRWNNSIYSLYQNIIKNIQILPWELSFLQKIDQLILEDEKIKVGELLKTAAAFYREIEPKEKSKTVNWEAVNICYHDPEVNFDTLWETVEKFWDKFDIEARELIVELLMLFIARHSDKKQDIRDNLEKDKTIRRICHHGRIKEIFGELTAPIQYRWYHDPISVPNLPGHIPNWLGDRKAVFYPGRAEMESEINNYYYLPDRLRSVIEPEGTLWIQIEEGGGRTALGIYLAYQAGERKFFPVRLTWPPANRIETGPAEPTLMTAMARAAAGEWLKVLPQHPAALLDLPSSHQKEMMRFLLWAVGHREALSFVLEKERHTSSHGQVAEAERKKWQHQMRVLQSRLQILSTEPTLSPPTSMQLLKWLGLRPAGLQGTCVIIELQRPLDESIESASDEILSLAAELARERVSFQVLALNVPKSFFPAIPLRWTVEELKAMLKLRQAEQLFAPPAFAQALEKLATASQGLPRTMMILGQLAIQTHIEREPQKPYLDEEDIEEAIRQYESTA